MRQRSKVSGARAKTRRTAAAKSKRRDTSKGAKRLTLPATGENDEISRLTRELNEAREQKTAIVEVLNIINSSPSDLAPVFDAMVERALRLCRANYGGMGIFEGDHYRVSSFRGVIPQQWAEQWAEFISKPVHVVHGSAPDRIRHGDEIVHIPDLAETPPERITPGMRALISFGKARTSLWVSLHNDNAVLGFFTIYWQEVRPFSEREIDLVRNFAAQAVIAIENARLVGEHRERTEEVVKLNEQLEQRVTDQLGEIERMGRLRRFLPQQVADLIVASGTEKQLESHRREITALFCDLRGFTGFSEASAPEDVMALQRDYHAAIGELIIKYSGTLERYAGDGVMVVFNDPVPVDNPALRAVQMALETREAMGALMEKWRELGHDVGFGIGIAHGFATLGTIGFEGRFDYAAIGTVSNVASRLCDEAKPGQILISPRVFTEVKDAVTVEPVGEFTLKGIGRPLAT